MLTCITSDIGGTNARFFLHEVFVEQRSSQLLLTKIYPSNDFDSLEDVLVEFLGEKECRANAPRFLVLSIAGAPKNNTIEKFSNIKWPGISGEKIAERFHFDNVTLLNDFASVGYSAGTMDFGSMFQLQAAKAPSAENYVVMGAGTGLGVVYVTRADGRLAVVSSEGGHHFQGFSSEIEREFQLFTIDRIDELYPDKHLQYADTEYLFCGLGLPVMYDFFYLKHNGELPKKRLAGQEIVAQFGKTPIGKDCLDLYMRILGRSINVVAKTFLPKGGKFILAGIIGKVLQRVFDSDEEKFWEMIQPFVYSDESSKKCLSRLDIHVSTTDLAEHAIEGCINYLFHSLEDLQ